MNPRLIKLANSLSYDWNRPHWRIIYYHTVPKSMRDQFTAQLDWFSERFQWCSITAGVKAVRDGSIDRPLLSLTFDDGDQSVHDVVLPLISERKISACAYLVPAYLDEGKSFRDTPPRPIMSWEDAKEWLSAGHEIGSHTYRHVAMSKCATKRMKQEAEWSKQVLENRLQTPVRHFAYPWGQHSAGARDVLRAGGWYDSVATIERGAMTAGDDAFSLKRDRCDLDKSIEEVEATMKLADRLYTLQRIRRRLQSATPSDHEGKFWDALPDADAPAL